MASRQEKFLRDMRNVFKSEDASTNILFKTAESDNDIKRFVQTILNLQKVLGRVTHDFSFAGLQNRSILEKRFDPIQKPVQLL